MNTDAVADRASRYKDCAMCLGNTNLRCSYLEMLKSRVIYILGEPDQMADNSDNLPP